MAENQIRTLETGIRDFINNPRKQHALLRNLAAWNKLCSCLDVIGDTELAFDAYESTPTENTSSGSGSLYILIYGVLQALVLQQDAVRNLGEALSVPIQNDPVLTEIRELRNDSVGHPTKRGGGAGRAFNFISRITMTRGGFELMTVYPDKTPPQFKHVSISSLISTQRQILQGVLSGVLDKLRVEEMEHREKFKHEKLAEVFPATLRYYFEKLYESGFGSKPTEFGTMHVRLVQEIIEQFRAKLRERGLTDVYDSVEHELKLISYPLDELMQYFTSREKSKLNDRDVFIFINFTEDRMDKLKTMAQEIDEEYQSRP